MLRNPLLSHQSVHNTRTCGLVSSPPLSFLEYDTDLGTETSYKSTKLLRIQHSKIQVQEAIQTMTVEDGTTKKAKSGPTKQSKCCDVKEIRKKIYMLFFPLSVPWTPCPSDIVNTPSTIFIIKKHRRSRITKNQQVSGLGVLPAVLYRRKWRPYFNFNCSFLF